MKASVNSIESMGLLDGPGIRTVIFFNSCMLRCKYCHNPEMWVKQKENFSVDELLEKIKRFKPYYRNNGGVTFSGGEPLLHVDFLIELSKKLKEEKIHIVLDTAGVGIGKYDELLKYIDLVILDIKHVEREKYKDLTGFEIDESLKFIESLNKSGKKVWIRQVIIPKVTDSIDYLKKLHEFISKIDNIKKIEFLPYHKLGYEKYKRLGISYPYEEKEEMDKEKCKNLYNLFEKMLQKKKIDA